MKNHLSIALIAVVLAWTSGILASAPQTMSYQGVLRISPDELAPDGNYNVTFRLYDVATGGTALWQEGQLVMVQNGRFNVFLGSVAPLDLPFDEQYYLGVQVGGDPEMEPRIQLAASPYALNVATNPGTVTQVATGAGLTGGPITTSGTISVAPSGIASAMLMTNAVTSDKIAAGAVTTDDLAANAVTREKILDEPGYNLQYGPTNGILNLTSVGQSFLSVDLDAPTGGYALVTGSANVFIAHTNGTLDNVVLKLSTVAGDVATPSPLTCVVRVPAAYPSDSDAFVVPATTTHVFAVPAGVTTFHLNGFSSWGTGNGLLLPKLTAVFLPSRFGQAIAGDEPSIERGGRDLTIDPR